MVTTDLNAVDYDGLSVYSDPSSWAAVRAAAAANTYDTKYPLPQTWTIGTAFLIRRVCLIFDTSGIPIGSVVSVLNLYFWNNIVADPTGVDSVYVVKKNDWTKPTNPIELGDYNIAYCQTKVGERLLSTISPTTWIAISLNLTDGINLGGQTALYLMMSRDFDNVGAALANCGTTNDGHIPYLHVEYTAGTSGGSSGSMAIQAKGARVI